MILSLIIISYILPLALFAVGVIFSKHSPEKINSFSGYRTARSMRNLDTWKEANRYSSKLMLKYSIILLVIITLSYIFAYRSDELLIAVNLESVILSFAFIIVSIIKTENHLKKMFE